MSTSQSRPAGITWAGFPPEVQFKILKEALCTEGVTGRGAPDIARLSFVCKDWEREIQSRRARVPQKKKREKGKHGKIVRVPFSPNHTSTSASAPLNLDKLESSLPPDHPDARYLESDDYNTSGSENFTKTQVVKEHTKFKQPELPPVWEDERNLEEPRKKGEANLPPLLVKEVLVWRDLEYAWGCIENNRGNVKFWCQVRAIFVEYVGVENNLKIAHRVFEGLRKEMILVRESGFEPQLQWLRLSVSVWGGIQDMDAPGMFPLSQMYNIPYVRFHSATEYSVSAYVAKPVREVIYKRTTRVRSGWKPTGLENPCQRGNWRNVALREKTKGQTENEYLYEFLCRKYDKMHRS
jgi:hypothetical protein